MNDYLFVTWDGGGNVPPALGIARELQERGNQVRVLGHATQRAQVVGAGLPFGAFPTARPFDSLRSNSPIAVIATFGDRAMGADVLDELETRPADVVVVDCLLFGVMDALARNGQRFVVLEHLFDAYLRGPWLKGPMGLGMRLKGLHPTRVLDAAARCLVVSSPQLDPSAARPMPENLTYTGPIVTGRPAEPTEPTVLVSLSTYAFSGMTRALQNVLDAVDGIGARVVVTTGPAIDAAALKAPAGVEVHAYVPHAELMPEISLVVGHGGHSTTMLALAHDLPMLIVPMHPFLDQPMVGRAVQDAGAGLTLKKKASPADLRRAIETLLADGPHRAAAAGLGAAIRAQQGLRAAADEISALVGNGVPTA